MSSGLNVHKKHVIEYAVSGWFSNDSRNFTRILRNLDVDFYQNEEEDEFEIERENLLKGIETLKKIDRKEETDVDVDIKELSICLDEESITLNELISCFEWLCTKSDQKHDTIYISYY